MASTERLQALDVVRGFALIGIFLMNIEFFNRPLSSLEQGLPTTLTGVDWLAGWLIYNFVQGKFWTMFSLLFGMGFAVMLTRAERADRNFIRPYLRRIAALAVFGIAHHIFIWGGDILFSYAVGAVGLLILLYGNWMHLVGALLPLIVCSFIPGFQPLQEVAGSLALICIYAMFLRGEWKAGFLGRTMPVFSIAFHVFGVALALTSAALWLVPGTPVGPRVPMTVAAVVVLLAGILSARFHDPVEQRTRRLGVAMYLFPLLMMTTVGAIKVFSLPEPAPANVTVVAGERSDRAARVQKEQADIAREQQILTSPSYLDDVRFRAGEFADHAPSEAGFATIIMGMFLLGAWFVRSGVMENTAAHLPLFRRLAVTALPAGVALGLVASFISTTANPDNERDPHLLAMGLQAIGNLPACLGYVSLIVLMLHSQSAFARIRVLAPLGRMALTNYLTQSILGTVYFYGFGLGHWGMHRSVQVLFVAVVIGLQLIFCHWWLSRFRFGPMEWLWRAITYWTLPPMRREAAAPVEAPQLSA